MMRRTFDNSMIAGIPGGLTCGKGSIVIFAYG